MHIFWYSYMHQVIRLHIVLKMNFTSWSSCSALHRQQPSPVYTQQPGFHGGEGQLGFTWPNQPWADYSRLSNCWVHRKPCGSQQPSDCCFSLFQCTTVNKYRWNRRHISEHYVHLRSSKHRCAKRKSTVNDRISGQLMAHCSKQVANRWSWFNTNLELQWAL